MAKSKGAKRGRKKKRVAAHIKEAAGKRAANMASGDADSKSSPLVTTPLGVGRPKRPREPAVAKAEDPLRKEKDRVEANSYLSAWLMVRKANQEAEEAGDASKIAADAGVWKFNKNTQAWLLRNLFKEDQVGEIAFETMCLYLEGLKGGGRERVLAEAQDIIDKHGPDEGEEQTASAREAAREASAAEKKKSDENSAIEPAANISSGYNSDSTEDEGDGSGVAEGLSTQGIKHGAAVPKAQGVTTSDGGNAPSASSKGFAFAFSEGNISNANGTSPEQLGDVEASDSDSEDGGSSEGEVTEEGSSAAAVRKKPRKARLALTGQPKAEAKAKAAATSYRRALQVAEVLA